MQVPAFYVCSAAEGRACETLMKKEDGTPLRRKYKKGCAVWQESEIVSEPAREKSGRTAILINEKNNIPFSGRKFFTEKDDFSVSVFPKLHTFSMVRPGISAHAPCAPLESCAHDAERNTISPLQAASF